MSFWSKIEQGLYSYADFMTEEVQEPVRRATNSAVSGVRQAAYAYSDFMLDDVVAPMFGKKADDLTAGDYFIAAVVAPLLPFGLLTGCSKSPRPVAEADTTDGADALVKSDMPSKPVVLRPYAPNEYESLTQCNFPSNCLFQDLKYAYSVCMPQDAKVTSISLPEDKKPLDVVLEYLGMIPNTRLAMASGNLARASEAGLLAFDTNGYPITELTEQTLLYYFGDSFVKDDQACAIQTGDFITSLALVGRNFFDALRVLGAGFVGEEMCSAKDPKKCTREPADLKLMRQGNDVVVAVKQADGSYEVDQSKMQEIIAGVTLAYFQASVAEDAALTVAERRGIYRFDRMFDMEGFLPTLALMAFARANGIDLNNLELAGPSQAELEAQAKLQKLDALYSKIEVAATAAESARDAAKTAKNAKEAEAQAQIAKGKLDEAIADRATIQGLGGDVARADRAVQKAQTAYDEAAKIAAGKKARTGARTAQGTGSGPVKQTGADPCAAFKTSMQRSACRAKQPKQK